MLCDTDFDSMERTSLKYENLSNIYADHPKDYNRQYCSIYLVRLKDMEILLKHEIEAKWSTKFPICKLHKLSEEGYDKCIVIGTLFKDQKLKPSILKQLAEANQLTPQPILSSFTDDSDLLFIEDELQRYQVLGKLEAKYLVTGITCALLGTDVGNGKFLVEDYVFAGYRKQIERPLFQDDIFVIFLSGLDFVNHASFVPNLELFTFRIAGMLGDVEHVSKICRIIIAGNSIRNVAEKHKPTISMTSRIGESSDTIEAVKSFDYFLSQVSEYVDVDVMPGENDPSNHILPQKQMHFCMFPKASVYNSLNLVSNPYLCSLDGLKLLGTSGQPVRDILRYSELEDPLEAMECCLKWNHLAPTAPDTLGCFPYYHKDPFIIEDCPHVLFAGNQPKFGSKIVKGHNGQEVCLISIPEFANNFEAVVLNLKNLECNTITFEVYNT